MLMPVLPVFAGSRHKLSLCRLFAKPDFGQSKTLMGKSKNQILKKSLKPLN